MNAACWAADENLLREAYFLPLADDGAKTHEAAVLWPRLFCAWEAYGQRVAKSQQGPLHRFLTLVHREIGLPPPAWGTFRDAVTHWHTAGRERLHRLSDQDALTSAEFIDNLRKLGESAIELMERHDLAPASALRASTDRDTSNRIVE